jgi:hypothetical protein
MLGFSVLFVGSFIVEFAFVSHYLLPAPSPPPLPDLCCMHSDPMLGLKWLAPKKADDLSVSVVSQSGTALSCPAS